jgi:3-oxoacyl-[acyl-carrier protein] reductase
MNLSEAKILITGASSGIGAETARLLIQKGAKVAITGRNLEKLKATAKEIGAIAIQADVCEESQVIEMTKTAIEKLGGLNVLINNAGYGYAAPVVKIDVEEFQKVFQTNVLGAALCAREAAQYFTNQKYGNIINIASTAALKGAANLSPYNATKFALRGMTESWRDELRKHNIRVMLVNPSEVMTDFIANMHTAQGSMEKTYSENEKATKLRGEEIAHTIASLLEMDDRGFITEATVFATNPQN